MHDNLNDAVSVLSIYSKRHNIFKPVILTWKGTDYRLGNIGSHEETYESETTLHHFDVTNKDKSMHFKLTFDSSNLSWVLRGYTGSVLLIAT